MKKLLSVIVCLIPAMAFSSCGNNSLYKEVVFEHSEYFSEGIRFEIPKEWSYTELERGTLFIFRNLGAYYGRAAKITPNEFEETGKEGKIKRIKDNLFIFKDDGHKTVYAKGEYEILKIEFASGDIKNKILNRFAKSIEFYDIKPKSTDTALTENSQFEITDTIDLSFLETPESGDTKYPIETVYATYNSLNTVAPLFGKEWIGERIGFLTMNNVAYFSLNCDDGYEYRFVENYTTDKFELWRAKYSEAYSDELSFETVYQKPLPTGCNIVTTNHRFIVHQAKYLIITAKEAEEIIEASDFSKVYKKKRNLSSYEIRNNIFSTEFYIAEAMAYFRITENYNSGTAFYTVSGINGNSEHITAEFLKFNTSKNLSTTASIENYRKLDLHFDD